MIDELETMNTPVETDEEWRLRKVIERVDTIRKQKLLDTDWYVIRQQETGEVIPEAVLTYRQSLRDITNQEGYPYEVVWPTQPNPS
jgi:DMSO/TMAO reductase YedYZ molybdopterin-dependent catalytic subunit